MILLFLKQVRPVLTDTSPCRKQAGIAGQLWKNHAFNDVSMKLDRDTDTAIILVIFFKSSLAI